MCLASRDGNSQIYLSSDSKFSSKGKFWTYKPNAQSRRIHSLEYREGFRKRTTDEFKHYLRISYGSVSELETQNEIAFSIHYLSDEQFRKIENDLDHLSSLLHGLIHSPSLFKT